MLAPKTLGFSSLASPFWAFRVNSLPALQAAPVARKFSAPPAADANGLSFKAVMHTLGAICDASHITS